MFLQSPYERTAVLKSQQTSCKNDKLDDAAKCAKESLRHKHIVSHVVRTTRDVCATTWRNYEKQTIGIKEEKKKMLQISRKSMDTKHAHWKGTQTHLSRAQRWSREP
jgi:hypothetical protein